MSLINTQILPFTAHAYHAGGFVEVTEADVQGKWAIFFFYPGDFTFVCPTELGDLAEHYDQLQNLGVSKRAAHMPEGQPVRLFRITAVSKQSRSRHVLEAVYAVAGNQTQRITWRQRLRGD